MDKENVILSSGSIRMVRFKRILLLTMAVCWVLRPSAAQVADDNHKDETSNIVTPTDHEKVNDTFKKETTLAKQEQGDEDPKKRETLEKDEESDQRPTESSSEGTERKKSRYDSRGEHGQSNGRARSKSKEGKARDKSKDKENNKGRGKPQDFGVTMARGKYLHKRRSKKVLQLPLTHPKSFLKNRAAPGARPAAAMASANFARRFVDSPLSHHPEAKLYRHRVEKAKIENNADQYI